MSSLYKLSVSGVRSFSPKENETIQFGAPLTLICGQNGCGKTTIIESLKYATTGDLPPNSKGGAFINDPTIADRLVVNAEIKLGFISVDGKSMTVTRNMQLNRKKGRPGAGAANTFKSLEGQLAIFLQGHKNSISTKNLELDTRVPLYLGASKAILEYVIFCHQDDSLWPLGEAGLLKKRFDEIFEAARFTKVLDNLKAIRKDLALDIKLIQGNVAHYASDKARALKIREKLHDSLLKVDDYSLQIAALVVRIEALEKDADRLFDSNQSFQRTLSEHERLRVLISSLETSRARLGASIHVLLEPDSELLHMLANFELLQADKRQLLRDKEARATSLDARLSLIREKAHVLSRNEGVLLSKAGECELNQARLREIELSSGLDGPDFLAGLRSDAERRRAEYGSFVSEHEASLALESHACHNLDNLVAAKNENLAYLSRDSAEKLAKIEDLRHSISALAIPEETMEIEASQLENLRSRLETKRQIVKDQNPLEIDEKKMQVRGLEAELDELMHKINAANKMSDLTSRVALLKESRSEKETVADRLVSLYQSRFLELVGADLASEAGESLMDQRVAHETKQMHEERNNWLKAKENLENAKSLLHYTKQQASLREAKKKTHLTNIEKVISDAEIPQYEKIIQEMEDDYKTAVYNLNTFEVTKSYKAKAMEIARSAKCCVLCNRAFAEKELSAFLDATDANIKSLTADKLTDDVKVLFNELDEMKSINVDVLEYRRITNETEDDGQEAANAALELANALMQKAELAFKASEQRLEKLTALAKPVAQIGRTKEEIGALDKQLQYLEAELQDQFGSVQTMEELQALHQQKSFEVKKLRQTVSDHIDKRTNLQKELSNLEGQVKDKELSISRRQLALNEAKAMMNSIETLEAQVHETENQKREISTEVLALEKDLTQRKSQLAQNEKEFQKEKSVLEEQVNEAKRALEEYQRISAAVKHFTKVEIPKIQENEALLAESKLSMERCNEQLAENAREMAEISKSLSEASSTERNIRDNVEYRQAGKELDRLKSQMSEMDISGAEKAKEEYQERSRSLRKQIADLNSQHYGKVGEVKQINDQISSLQKELQEEFKDVEKTYHNEWLKLQSNLLVSNDILTYSQAMDNAIMQYHSMKMSEINRILRELWSQTYKGTDIDGIEIKCDVTHVSQTRGRSYNYRVVMYKKNSELDMRGRCSAGQKVLTSILIRLALAECFGTNCGMIALDEPTTNLDTENAELLANALNNIIDFRKLQKNFQLIIITHDEKFLGHINGDAYTDNFYRIERDENQHSVIRSLPIHLMQDN